MRFLQSVGGDREGGDDIWDHTFFAKLVERVPITIKKRRRHIKSITC